MRIGIYVEVARDERPTGIGRHVLCLLEALARQDKRNEYLLYYPARLSGGVRSEPGFPQQPNFKMRPVRFPHQWHAEHPRLWWNWYLPWALRRDRVDVFHGPNHFAPRFDAARTVVTIHDLAYFFMDVHGGPMNRVMQTWTRHALANSGQVIALSENTRQDLERLQVPADKIRVIYGGGNVVAEKDIAYSRRSELREKLNLPERYILCVGAIQPRKNIPFLVRAYARMQKQHEVVQDLVLAGPKDSATEEVLKLCEELGISQRVHLTGYLEDWQLPLLYKGADLFVLPSRYEGFTLVTLEAMAYGVPLVATDSSSIREGVGDSGLLVTLDDVEQLAGEMRRALIDEPLRKNLVQRGKAQSMKFTWEQCAAETLSLYEKLSQPAALKRIA